MPIQKNTRLVYLDTLPILRLLEFHPDYYPIMSRLLDQIYENRIQMITSTLVLQEVATAAFRKNQEALAQQYHEFFTRSSRLSLRELDTSIAMRAAALRAQHHLGTAEAISLATAQHCGADFIIAGNTKWQEWCPVEVITLENAPELI